jgi:hypothetical protein
MGCVEELHLEGTPDLVVFFSRLILLGFALAKRLTPRRIALLANDSRDPARPFARQPPQMPRTDGAQSRLAEWSILRAINQNMALGDPARYIEFCRRSHK